MFYFDSGGNPMPIRVSTGLGNNGTFGFVPAAFPALSGAGGVLCGAPVELQENSSPCAGPTLGSLGQDYGSRLPGLMAEAGLGQRANPEMPGIPADSGKPKNNTTHHSKPHGRGVEPEGAPAPSRTEAAGIPPPFQNTFAQNCPCCCK